MEGTEADSFVSILEENILREISAMGVNGRDL